MPALPRAQRDNEVGSYYYLAAQLPYLVYGQALPMSPSDFAALARDSMSAADGKVLDYCTLDPEPCSLGQLARGASYAEPAPRTPSAFVNKWKEWERTLRLNLAKIRSQKLASAAIGGREGALLAEAPDHPSDAAGAAKTAMAMESPLDAELFLDKARWDAIENFQGIDSFSESAMYAYLLKLLLMERRMMFTVEEGSAEYKRLYAEVLGSKSFGDEK